jgi:prepilin-type processing-associated H-X9-DG protein
MSADRQSEERQRPSPTFSLRTLFLAIAAIGVFFAVLRVADGFWAFSAFFALLWIWFLVAGQKDLAKFAGIAMAVSLAITALVPRDRYTDGNGHRNQCRNNLKWIGMALHAYHQKYGSFPPAYVADANGKPLYSWRVLILPFLDEANLRNAIRSDEAWDGPNNVKSTRKGVAVFNCPSELQSQPPSASWPSALTSYVAVVGPHTAWAGATPRKLSDFKDPSTSILVVEIANSGIRWAEPRDLDVGKMSPGIDSKFGQGVSSDHPGEANVLFADGSIHGLDSSIDPKILSQLLDLDGCSDPGAY